MGSIVCTAASVSIDKSCELFLLIIIHQLFQRIQLASAGAGAFFLFPSGEFSRYSKVT